MSIDPPLSERGRSLTIDRRVFLLGTLGLWLGSCSSTVAADEEVARLAGEIEQRLESLAEDEAEAARFRELVARIREEAEGFLRQHADFSKRLVDASRDRGAESVELRQLVLDSSRERQDLRGRLLLHQEQLKLALGKSRWTEVVDGLNDAEAMSRVVGRRL